MSDWLVEFESIEPVALARGESDFPLALRSFREAVARGDEHPHEWQWCSEIYMRVIHDLPAATEAEYYDMKDWYFRNESVLYRADIRDEFINTYTRGPRKLGATEFIAKLRALRASHPESA
jgi:hypothetical protein